MPGKSVSISGVGVLNGPIEGIKGSAPEYVLHGFKLSACIKVQSFWLFLKNGAHDIDAR
jgi:hypothetical protein